ncbi:hypothetical protein CJJ07_004208 [Candidozyma auris]|nr:hypothetical protein CJJ07_004208 [[Candida] auris]QEL60901.1 hypothetical protein CJJ09_003021 [[Candida] auris]
MKFSTAVVSGLVATTAVSATPVASTEMARRDNTVVVLQDIENLLGHVVNDVSKVLADAGVNKKEFFGPILAPLDLDKRDDSVSKRDEATSEANVPAVVIDVGKLVSDILADVAKIVADSLIPF